MYLKVFVLIFLFKMPHILSFSSSNFEFLNMHISLGFGSARSLAPVLPICVYTCIHVVNYTAKSYVNDNTWSRTCALIPLCRSCDFYVNWKDFSMLEKQYGRTLQIYSTVVTSLELNTCIR